MRPIGADNSRRKNDERMDEEEIIKCICIGGRSRDAAVKTLYYDQAQTMLRFFASQGASADEARDILQNTMVKIVRSAGSFNGGGTAKAWLWQIARNCLLDFHQQNSRVAMREVTVIPEKWAELVETTAAPQVCSAAMDTDACVATGLAASSAARPERAFVLGLQMDGLSIDAIGQQIGRSIAATKEYLSQCRKKIQPFIAHCADLLSN